MKAKLVTTGFFALAALTAFVFAISAAPEGVGAKFGARDPRTCQSKKEPTKGAISAEQAKQYFICDTEKLIDSDDLQLVDNVKVEVGKARPYQQLSDSHPDIDTTAPLYPIRGSLTRYICHPVSSYMNNAGKNCSSWNEPNATGVCYKTTFGDWNCAMTDLSGIQTSPVPPPK